MSERFAWRLRRGFLIGSLALTVFVLAMLAVYAWDGIRLLGGIYADEGSRSFWKGMPELLLVGASPLFGHLNPLTVFTGLCSPVIVFLLALTLSPEKLATVASRGRAQRRLPPTERAGGGERLWRRLRYGVIVGSLVLAVLVMAVQGVSIADMAGGIGSGLWEPSDAALVVWTLLAPLLLSLSVGICPPVIVLLLALSFSPEKVAAVMARNKAQTHPPAVAENIQSMLNHAGAGNGSSFIQSDHQ